MEAVKNRLTRLGRDAWSFVVDADSHLVADAGDGDLDETAGRRKADRIVDDRIDRPCEPIRLAHDDGAFLARTGEGEARITGFAARFPAVDKLLHQRSEIDPLEPRTGKFCIGPGGLADVADQPVKPDHVLAHDRLQLFT